MQTAPGRRYKGQGDLQPVQRHELAFGTVDPVAGIGRLRVARTASKIPTNSLTYGFGRRPLRYNLYMNERRFPAPWTVEIAVEGFQESRQRSG